MKTILVVDDSLEVREVLSLIFSESFGLCLARSGLEAAEIFMREKVDLVISDLEMPDGDGFWLLNYLRVTLESEIPVVIMSGHPALTEEKVLGAGASVYLPKPFDLSRLRSIVKLLLEVA